MGFIDVSLMCLGENRINCFLAKNNLSELIKRSNFLLQIDIIQDEDNEKYKMSVTHHYINEENTTDNRNSIDFYQKEVYVDGPPQIIFMVNVNASTITFKKVGEYLSSRFFTSGKPARTTFSGTFQGTKKNTYKIDYFYASDEINSQNALLRVVQGINSQAINLNNNNEVQLTILPCTHNLGFRSNGNCDGNQWFQTNIFRRSYKHDKLQTTTHDNKNITFIFNWEQYVIFYNGDKYLNKHSGSMVRMNHCRETSLLDEINISKIVKQVISKNIKQVAGKKTRKKRSRKRSNLKTSIR